MLGSISKALEAVKVVAIAPASSSRRGGRDRVDGDHLAESVRQSGGSFVPFQHEIEFRHQKRTSCGDGQSSQMRAMTSVALIAIPRSSQEA